MVALEEKQGVTDDVKHFFQAPSCGHHGQGCDGEQVLHRKKILSSGTLPMLGFKGQ